MSPSFLKLYLIHFSAFFLLSAARKFLLIWISSHIFLILSCLKINLSHRCFFEYSKIKIKFVIVVNANYELRIMRRKTFFLLSAECMHWRMKAKYLSLVCKNIASDFLVICGKFSTAGPLRGTNFASWDIGYKIGRLVTKVRIMDWFHHQLFIQ